MKYTARQIAEILGGRIEGNPEAEVFKLSKIEEGEKGSLTFLSNPKYNPHLYTTGASVTIINENFQLERAVSLTLIRVKDAYKSFSKLLEFYQQVKNNKQGRETPSYVSSSASVGKGGYIGAFCYIGDNAFVGDNVKIYPNSYIGDNVVIGSDCTIYAGVKIYSETKIGNNCTFHSGCIIGSDGFGFSPDEKGELIKVPQTGNVIIEDNVEIGSSSTIDRATLGATVLRSGVKLDNQVQIAHNVEIGKNTAIAAQSGIAGSTKIGNNCMIGGQVGISGHLNLGNNLKIQAQSGVTKNLKDNDVVQGTPAFGFSNFNRSYVYFKNLPKTMEKINRIERGLPIQTKSDG